MNNTVNMVKKAGGQQQSFQRNYGNMNQTGNMMGNTSMPQQSNLKNNGGMNQTGNMSQNGNMNQTGSIMGNNAMLSNSSSLYGNYTEEEENDIFSQIEDLYDVSQEEDSDEGGGYMNAINMAGKTGGRPQGVQRNQGGKGNNDGIINTDSGQVNAPKIKDGLSKAKYAISNDLRSGKITEEEADELMTKLEDVYEDLGLAKTDGKVDKDERNEAKDSLSSLFETLKSYREDSSKT